MASLLIALLLFVLTLTGCGSNGSGSVAIHEEKPPVLNLRGYVSINKNISYPTYICGNNDYQFRDLSIFSLTIQDNPREAYVSSNGEFSFEEMSPSQQIVLFCKCASYPNLVFEWMGASSSGLSGDISAQITIDSTARSYIARTLRDVYGRRVKPEAIGDQYIATTVDAITHAIQDLNSELAYKKLCDVSSVKKAYTTVAKALADGESGKFPSNHVFLFYMAGDNNLGKYMENNMNNIAKIGQPTDTQIVFQLDTAHSLPTLGKTGAARYVVASNSLELLDNLGTIDSSAPTALTDFIKISMRRYPAKSYSLILNSHGGGWYGNPRPMGSTRAIFMTDETSIASGTILNTARSIKQALEENGAAGRKFDMIILDSCNMGNIETVYELKDYTDYVVCSEALMPGEGIPYDRFMREVEELCVTSLSSRDKASVICKHFVDKYVDRNYGIDTGISIIDTNLLDLYINTFKTYVDKIKANSPQYTSVMLNKRNAKTITDDESSSGSILEQFGGDNEFVDLKQLISECRNILNECSLESDELLSILDRMIIYSKYSKKLRNANGLSITFPNKTVYDKYYSGFLPANEYFMLDFNKSCQWHELFKLMFE